MRKHKARRVTSIRLSEDEIQTVEAIRLMLEGEGLPHSQSDAIRFALAEVLAMAQTIVDLSDKE